MSVNESGEMYLENILLLSKKKNTFRAIELVEQIGYSKPSVSRALAKLREQKHIIVDNDGYIALTESGRNIAEKIYERHTVLTELFIRLGVDEENASNDACRIEHIISDATFDAIKKHSAKYTK